MLPVMEYAVDVKNLKKSFGNMIAVKNVTLQINQGEIFGFLGPNGCGKTTTIRMLCGLLTPDSGQGSCLGYDIIKDASSIKYHAGYVAQFFTLYKTLTVLENLQLVAELYGLTDRKQRVKEIVAQLGLETNQSKLAGSLSGGWKQKLSLAAALLHSPSLMLLDEPTASIDPEARQDFWELIHDLANRGITVMLTSHNMDEIEHCDRIAYLNKGSVMISGTIQEVIHQVQLTTWSVKGKNLPLLAKQLKLTPGIDQVTSFSELLHVSGRDVSALEQAITPYFSNPNLQWAASAPSLEDAFAWLAKIQE